MIEVITTDPALEALGPAWDALWARCPEATPFQSPRWLLPWWHAFGTGLPRVAAAWEEGVLVGVLPLYILPGERKALPIGAGTSDYLDGLGQTAGLLEAVLARLRTEVETCDLIELPPGSALRMAAAPGWEAVASESSPCPVLLPDGIPAAIRRKLRMNRNRAERAGGWTMELAGAQDWPVALETLFRLHQARWIAHGESGVLADAVVTGFWREAASLLLAGGMLSLATLRLGGEPAASILALRAQGRIFFYLSGYDEAHAFVSPGTLLLGALLEHAFAEGCREAHFLRGQEAYKYAWGARDRMNASVRLRPHSAGSG